MEERTIRVQRTARYHVLGNLEAAPRIWIVLHGYGQLARYFLKNFEEPDAAVIVAPEGLGRFYLDEAHTRVGASWMTREDRLNEIADQIAYLDALAGELATRALPGAPVHVLGFSQGVATASRWAVQGRTAIAQLVLWAGTIPPELDREMLKKWHSVQVELVIGRHDPLVDPGTLEDAVQRLERSGIRPTTHLFEGGHALEPALLQRLIRAH